MITVTMAAGCSSLTSGSGLRGGIKASKTKETAVTGVNAANRVYVPSFDLDPSLIKTDQGIGGAADRTAQSGGILGRLAQKPLFADRMGSTPDDKASTMVRIMQQSLVDDLKAQGFEAIALPTASAPLPQDGWLLKGQFLLVDEGNRLERSAIGFGEGATQLDLEVSVIDLRSKNADKPFLVLSTAKESSKMPGSAYNPYALAAKFRMEKNATEKDIKMTADFIVSELLKYRDQFRAEALKNPGIATSQTNKP